MTDLALRPGPPPCEAEAWLALLDHGPLERVRHPKELKEEMYNYLASKWDMSESKIDFSDFGILWIDTHYRDLTTKMASTGPGYETFSIATYRIMKTARLEGYWDRTLENLADWISDFAADYKSRVSVSDFERLLDAMPASRDLTVYETNLARLFWGPAASNKGNNRTPDLLTALPMDAYDKAFSILKAHPPDDGWEIRELMYQINHRGILGKSIMLHIGLWFNPALEEPANRANHKHPMIDHIKPAFSRYDPSHPLYEGDDSWKENAISVQKVIVDHTLEQWPKGSLVMGKLDTIQRMSVREYEEYLSKPFWEGLISEIRKVTDIPFLHPALRKHNPVVKETNHPPASTWTAVPRSAIMEQVDNTIRDEDSDGTPPLSVEGDSTTNGGRRSRGHNSNQRSGSGSAQSDALDYIVVGENVTTNNGQSKRKRAPTVKQEANEEDLLSAQNKRRKIAELKIPENSSLVTQGTGTPSASTSEQPQGLAKRRSASQRSSLPIHAAIDDIPLNTIVSSARAALASMQPSPYTEPKRSSSLRAAPLVLPSQLHETIQWDGNESDLTPSRRLRRHNLPNAANQQAAPSPTSHQQPTSILNTQQPANNPSHQQSTNTPNHQHPVNTPKSHQANPTPSSHQHATNTSNHQPPHHTYQHYQPSPNQQHFPQHSSHQNYPPPPSQFQIQTQLQFEHPRPSQPPSDSLPVTPQMTESPAPAGRGKIEQAILVLQEQYGEKLQIKEMLAAIKLLKNEVDATVFLTLKPGRLRNAWLANEIKGC